MGIPHFLFIHFFLFIFEAFLALALAFDYVFPNKLFLDEINSLKF